MRTQNMKFKLAELALFTFAKVVENDKS